MKVLVDMNLSPKWLALLEERGHAARHWSKAGEPRAHDSEIMAWAGEEGFLVLTHDLDFGAVLAATGALRPSVVLLRAQDVMPEAVGEAILDVLDRYRDELSSGAIAVVDEARSRVRLLPLRRYPAPARAGGERGEKKGKVVDADFEVVDEEK
jgi:predicted nuclease of predicted toxin-antitoxin system